MGKLLEINIYEMCHLRVGTKGVFNIAKVYIKDDIAYLISDNDNTVIRVDVKNKKIAIAENAKGFPQDTNSINAKPGGLLSVLVVAGIGNCVAIWTDALPYNNVDMCNSLTEQMNQVLSAWGIQTVLSMNGWTFEHNASPITLQSAFEIIPQDASLDAGQNGASISFDITENWHREYKYLNQVAGLVDVYSVVPDGTCYFYPCAYICPTCGRNMSKVLIKPGNRIKVEGSWEEIGRAFVCKYCNNLFTNSNNTPLSSGEYISLKTSRKRFNEIVEMMDYNGRHNEL